MNTTSFAAQAVAWMNPAAEWLRVYGDGIFVRASVPAWIICIGCLSPAVYRIARRRPRYLDPIWGLMTLLALNRLSFLFHVSAIGSHASAVLLAIAMAWLSTSYQRHDRGHVDA